jgi:uroporphyrinogen decarboxylase
MTQHHLGLKTASRTEIETALRCEPSPAGPLFLPAIYEHKAWFVKSTPSAVSRDGGLLARALLAEYETLSPDALTVGIDVYNIEAEAAGCSVTYYEDADTSVPSLGSHVIKEGDDLSGAPLPNPLTDGRMPVNIMAARETRRALGNDFWLRGAVSGPFSLAVSLAGADALFMACLESPEWVHGVLDYATRVVQEYAKAYIDAGAGLVIFDSQASPDLISPAMYERFVLPATQKLIQWAAAQGVRDVPLVVGGNTLPIAGLLVRTGANNLLCDFTAGVGPWIDICRGARRALRRNISPSLTRTLAPDRIYELAREEARRHKEFPGFIMGTGVLPFGTPVENILAIRSACKDAAG